MLKNAMGYGLILGGGILWIIAAAVFLGGCDLTSPSQHEFRCDFCGESVAARGSDRVRAWEDVQKGLGWDLVDQHIACIFCKSCGWRRYKVLVETESEFRSEVVYVMEEAKTH